jgi:hypothetical protein
MAEVEGRNIAQGLRADPWSLPNHTPRQAWSAGYKEILTADQPPYYYWPVNWWKSDRVLCTATLRFVAPTEASLAGLPRVFPFDLSVCLRLPAHLGLSMCLSHRNSSRVMGKPFRQAVSITSFCSDYILTQWYQDVRDH